MNSGQSEQVVAWLWALAPMTGMVVTLVLALRTHRFLARATRAPGRIARVTTEQQEQWRGQGQGNETVTSYFAHVEFTSNNGSPVEVRSASLNHPPQVGGTVTVAYEPAHPETTARIDDGVVWRPTVIAGALTIALSLSSIATLWGQPILALPIAAGAMVASLAIRLGRSSRG